tara:strand:+ start:800 stop:1207 length:408 start_codon:yes stop_codon:yes gene_type:complete
MNKLQKKMFSELLYWGGAKTEDGKGAQLNKFAILLAIFFICKLTREKYKNKGNVIIPYETLADIGWDFSRFAQWEGDATPNRVKEALESLSEIGFLTVDRDETNSIQREKYGYRGKSILFIEINLESFGDYSEPE